MYQQFDNGISSVLATLTSESHKRANRHYYALLRSHLVSNALPYSHQAALDWLSKSESILPRWKFVNCRNAVFKLNDNMTNGTIISVGLYPYDTAPKYVKLPLWSRELLDAALDKTKYTGNGKNTFRISVAEFLYFLDEHGVSKETDISIKHFVEYLSFMEKAHDNTSVRRDYIRYVGVFMSELSNSDAFQVLTKKQGTSSVIFIDDLPVAQRNSFLNAVNDGKKNSIPIDIFYRTIAKEDELLSLHQYSLETRRKYSGFWKSLCLFLLLNELDYSPQIAQRWSDYCGRKQLFYPQLKNLNHLDNSDNGAKKIKLSSGQKSMAALPEWSRELLKHYILSEQRRGQEQTTLETQRYACIKFLRFLEQCGIEHCEGITPAVLKEFNCTDIHTTPEGKKGYNSRVGRFLEFLGEQGLVPKTLRLALPCKIAKKVSIVKTLSESEINILYLGKDQAENRIALRDAAIVMIGLQMGLRAGDIINLKYSDISWERGTISISQNKTKKPLLLPMPVTVGNCIYRYIVQGRPSVDRDYIFISHKAPYSKLQSAACADGLNRMLNICTKSVGKYGSRMMRKTFASRLLKFGNSADSIANLLGHDGNHSVMTYISTDSEKMRMCALSAKKVALI